MDITKDTTVDTVDAAVDLALARAWAASGEARRLREAANLSIAEIADSVHSADTTIWRWEKGRSAPHGPAAARYGRLLRRLATEVLS